MKTKRSLPKKRTLWFSAQGESPDGTIKRFRVYTKGASIEIVGPNLRPYPCHSSRTDLEGVKQEISILFNVKVTKIEYPGKKA